MRAQYMFHITQYPWSFAYIFNVLCNRGLQLHDVCFYMEGEKFEQFLLDIRNQIVPFSNLANLPLPDYAFTEAVLWVIIQKR